MLDKSVFKVYTYVFKAASGTRRSHYVAGVESLPAGTKRVLANQWTMTMRHGIHARTVSRQSGNKRSLFLPEPAVCKYEYYKIK